MGRKSGGWSITGSCDWLVLTPCLFPFAVWMRVRAEKGTAATKKKVTLNASYPNVCPVIAYGLTSIFWDAVYSGTFSWSLLCTIVAKFPRILNHRPTFTQVCYFNLFYLCGLAISKLWNLFKIVPLCIMVPSESKYGSSLKGYTLI